MCNIKPFVSRSICSALLFCSLAGASLAAVAATAGDTACHVILANGEHVVKFVDTNKRNVARKVALATPFYTDTGSKERVVEVVQCISYPNGIFLDSAMQKYMTETPQ